MSEFKLLRKVENLDTATAEYVAEHERNFPYIRQGFVDADWPRAAAYTEAIREATTGFAVADENGVVQRTYKTLEAAEAARSSAKVVLAVDVPDPEESADDEDESSE